MRSSATASLLRLLATAALTVAACSPVISTMQPAAVHGMGHFGVTVGAAGTLPVGPLVDAVDEGKEFAEKVATARESGDITGLTKADIDGVMRAAAAGAVNSPTVSPDVAVSMGIWPDWEVTGRFAGNGLRAGIRNQILDGLLLGLVGTWGVGVGYAAIDFPIEALEPLQLDGFKRYEADGHFFLGWDGWLTRLWAGPKVLVTKYESGASVPILDECSPTATIDGTATYLAATAGAALGLRLVYVAVEVTAGRVETQTTVTGDYRCPAITSEPAFALDRVDNQGLVVGAEAAVMMRF